MNINCVDLVKFEELEGEYDLIFEGPISKIKDTYSIDRSISNGKIKNSINRSGTSSQSGTISFVLRISKKTNNFYKFLVATFALFFHPTTFPSTRVISKS